ncbi:Methylated-DNA--protein-cysteine methyltransferase [Enhygromyxa salina]|uniref:Methylated-DNA--protein-cysteine methyltransferase n=1 Tax=Enhygromyxa salina TaxID=215803 RepID=A0A2S9YGC5_9BACT|nr:MGMT family protein [Enhygromyxa salina]PRQ04149.1 Methylated-DNA--protein-cysteine methyltransferase [Enhygromyxa salina]
MNSDWLAICATVEAIPRGRVASYGQVAELAGLPGRARLVGRVLSHLPPGSEVPWQRVVNARGEISLPDDAGARQRRLLEREGVSFSASGKIDMRRFGVLA